MVKPTRIFFVFYVLHLTTLGTQAMSFKNYYHLVVDGRGETSLICRDFTDVEEVGYSNVPQLVRKLSSAKPTGVVFTRMSGENPWHHCPSPQIVACLDGAWTVKTTDGKTTVLSKGDVLFQDNTSEHPTAEEGTKKAQHFSGIADGFETCNQLIVQLEQPDGPIPPDSDTLPL